MARATSAVYAVVGGAIVLYTAGSGFCAGTPFGATGVPPDVSLFKAKAVLVAGKETGTPGKRGFATTEGSIACTDACRWGPGQVRNNLPDMLNIALAPCWSAVGSDKSPWEDLEEIILLLAKDDVM
jgi:hypothetical protein